MGWRSVDPQEKLLEQVSYSVLQTANRSCPFRGMGQYTARR